MGAQFLFGFMEQAGDLASIVSAHCASNCFPPIPPAFVPSLVRAVLAVREGEGSLYVPLPAGYVFQGKRSHAVARDLVVAARLEVLAESNPNYDDVDEGGSDE